MNRPVSFGPEMIVTLTTLVHSLLWLWTPWSVLRRIHLTRPCLFLDFFIYHAHLCEYYGSWSYRKKRLDGWSRSKIQGGQHVFCYCTHMIWGDASLEDCRVMDKNKLHQGGLESMTELYTVLSLFLLQPHSKPHLLRLSNLNIRQ